jgi:putative ABC transport system permease protein
MVIRNSIISASRALKRSKARTALTSLGVIIGILSVVALYGIGSSARVSISKQVYNYGTNSISIASYYKTFSQRDIDNIRRIIPQLKYISPVVLWEASMLQYKGRHLQTRMWGVNNDYFKMMEWDMEDGSVFSDSDILSYERVVIIGSRVKEELFKNRNPLGEPMLIDKTPYIVSGVLTPKGESISGRDFDNVIMIPYTTAGSRFFGSKDFKFINVSVESEREIDFTEKMLRKYFKSMYNLEQSEAFVITTSKEGLKRAEDILKNITMLVVITAAISLIVGGIGIMNIMLVSVSERTREIGIRMAIGAKSRDIMTQFLIESLMLSSVGGFIGIILGIIINYIVVALNNWPFIFSFISVLLSFTFTTSVGILFGFYPAYKASQLNPIDALRHE